jgi:hypothetical protein
VNERASTLAQLAAGFEAVTNPVTLAYIVDVDGTLCDVSSITYLVSGPHKDFDKFHEMSAGCPPVRQTVDDLHQVATDDNVVIIVVTGRQEKFRFLTDWWLQQHDIPYHTLLMRPNGDFRPDVAIKQQILDDIRANGFYVIGTADDNPAVIEKVWRPACIPIIKVVPGWAERNESARPLGSGG